MRCRTSSPVSLLSAPTLSHSASKPLRALPVNSVKRDPSRPVQATHGVFPRVLWSVVVSGEARLSPVVVLDPKADLVRDVLALIPRDRLDDVVVPDPTQANPVCPNPLVSPGSSAELTADGILAIFKAIDFESLPAREVYTRLINGGEQTGWISVAETTQGCAGSPRSSSS